MLIHAKDSKGNILATVDTSLPQPMICGCVAVSDDGNLFQIIERNCYTHRACNTSAVNLLGSNRSTLEASERAWASGKDCA